MRKAISNERSFYNLRVATTRLPFTSSIAALLGRNMDNTYWTRAFSVKLVQDSHDKQVCKKRQHHTRVTHLIGPLGMVAIALEKVGVL